MNAIFKERTTYSGINSTEFTATVPNGISTAFLTGGLIEDVVDIVQHQFTYEFTDEDKLVIKIDTTNVKPSKYRYACKAEYADGSTYIVAFGVFNIINAIV